MKDLRRVTCCFSGYRVEKMPFAEDDDEAIRGLYADIEHTVLQAVSLGYTRFMTGMSTGFDLWAADVVIALKKRLFIDLLCAIPFAQQVDSFPPAWRTRYQQALAAAKESFPVSAHYHVGCYMMRNQFMVDASSLLICYFDGQSGGTAQTVQMAKKGGLEIINIADPQLTLPL